MFDSYTTDSMECTLQALQSVPPFDFERATHTALAGNGVHSFTAAGIARMRGELLALDVWRARMHATLELRP